MRSVYRYRPRPERDQEVIGVLMKVAHRKVEYGFGKLFETLRRRGHGWNHKRVYRLYRALQLNNWRNGKQQLPSLNPEPLAATRQMSEC